MCHNVYNWQQGRFVYSSISTNMSDELHCIIMMVISSLGNRIFFFLLYYNLMEPLTHIWSIINHNIIMWYMTVLKKWKEWQGYEKKKGG